MKKRRMSIQIKLVLLICAAAIALIMDGVGVVLLNQGIQDKIMATYAYQQYDSVVRVMRHMKSAYEAAPAKNRDADRLFTTYIQEEKSTVNGYWFLYREDQILFEQDAMQTGMLEEKSLQEAISHWQNNGGKELSEAERLFRGEIRTATFSKAGNRAAEIVSAIPYEVDGVTYIIGYAANADQIYDLCGYSSYRLRLYLGSAVLAMIIVLTALVIFRLLHNQQRFKERQEDLQRNYRSGLTRLDQELKERRRQVKDYQLMDVLSLFYNREYFYTLLLNMKRQNLKSLGMIVIELEDFHDYLDRYGMGFEQDALSQVRDCLKACLMQDSIIARVKENRIVITVVSNDYKAMFEECNMLEQSLQGLSLPIGIKVYSVTQMPNENAMEMYRRVNKIISVQS